MSDSSQPVEEQPGRTQPPHTQWHRLLARLFELLLTNLGVTVLTELPVMSEPPKIDILVMRRSGASWTEQQMRLLCDGLRNVIARTVIIEFKYSESLTVKALRQAIGYDHFYCAGQDLSDDEVATFVMVARTPRRGVLAEFGYEPSELPGVYHSRNPVSARVQIIVLNELRLDNHNAFVQCFASKRRVRNAAFDQLQEMGEGELTETVMDFVLGLHGLFEPKGVKVDKVTERGIITPDFVMELGQEIRRLVIASSKPEERLAGLAPEQRLAGLAPEDRLAGLAPEDRLAGLKPDEMARLMEQVEAYLRQSHD